MTARKNVTQCRSCTRGITVQNSRLRRTQREAKAPGSHTRAEWRTIVRNQQECCYWCGKSLRDAHGRLRPEKDHLTPLSRNGTDYSWNLAAVCKPCNVDKGDMTAGEYRTYLSGQNKKSTVTIASKRTATRRKSRQLKSQMSFQFPEWPAPEKKIAEAIALIATTKAMEESVLVFKGYDFDGQKKNPCRERRELLRDQAKRIIQERRA